MDSRQRFGKASIGLCDKGGRPCRPCFQLTEDRFVERFQLGIFSGGPLNELEELFHKLEHRFRFFASTFDQVVKDPRPDPGRVV